MKRIHHKACQRETEQTIHLNLKMSRQLINKWTAWLAWTCQEKSQSLSLSLFSWEALPTLDWPREQQLLRLDHEIGQTRHSKRERRGAHLVCRRVNVTKPFALVYEHSSTNSVAVNSGQQQHCWGWHCYSCLSSFSPTLSAQWLLLWPVCQGCWRQAEGETLQANPSLYSSDPRVHTVLEIFPPACCYSMLCLKKKGGLDKAAVIRTTATVMPSSSPDASSPRVLVTGGKQRNDSIICKLRPECHTFAGLLNFSLLVALSGCWPALRIKDKLLTLKEENSFMNREEPVGFGSSRVSGGPCVDA